MNILRVCVSAAGISWVIGGMFTSLHEGDPDFFAAVTVVFFTLNLGVGLVLLIQQVQDRKEGKPSGSLDPASEKAEDRGRSQDQVADEG